jgi:hypothetical protein
MQLQNLSLPKLLQSKVERIKWYLWRGNTQAALMRLKTLVINIKSKNAIKKLNKLSTYISNNNGDIVDYMKKNNNLYFTSNNAEATVESLINQRCKGNNHIRRTREGIHPLLQIRAAIARNN